MNTIRSFCREYGNELGIGSEVSGSKRLFGMEFKRVRGNSSIEFPTGYQGISANEGLYSSNYDISDLSTAQVENLFGGFGYFSF